MCAFLLGIPAFVQFSAVTVVTISEGYNIFISNSIGCDHDLAQ